MCVNDILRDIEDCRSKMVKLAAVTSFTNHRVIETSIKLDRLLNKYYILTSKK